MDQWDPSKEAYENRNFNCYNQGVGRDLSGSSMNNKGATLLVQGIPPTLEKVGFLNMFLEHGKVIKHTLIPSSEDARGFHGYITYENMLDAEAAISHLDKKKIGQYTLKVQPALTEEERRRRKKQKQDEEKLYNYARRDTPARASDITPSSSSFQSQHHMEDRSYKDINESTSHFQSSEMKQDNGSWQQQQPKLGGVGRGKILPGAERDDTRQHLLHSMDRGAAPSHYASQESLACHQKPSSHGYQKPLSQGYQHQPVQGHYQDDDDFVKTITPPRGPKARGICVNCFRGGCVDVCSRCKMYYCSNVCQKEDWPRHAEICSEIREYYENNGDISSIPHGDASRMGNSSRASFDDDVESCYSQAPGVHRNDRTRGSNSTRFEEKGQGMRHFKESNNGMSNTCNERSDNYRGPSSNTEYTDSHYRPSANTESQRGQKGKDVFNNESICRQSQIVGRDNYSKKNVEGNLERNFNRHQDERSTTVVSQKLSKPADNRINSNSRNIETREQFPRRNAALISSNQETNVKDKSAPVKTNDGELIVGAKNGNQGFQSKQEEATTTLGKQKSDAKKDDKKSTWVKAATKEAEEKLPSPVDIRLAVGASGRCLLTYFESPYKFWISLEECLGVFTDIDRIMGQVLSESSTTPVAVKVGGTYGIFFQGEWSRVTVMSIDGREVTVFFIDFGNQTTVKQEELRILTVEMLELPAQAVCCCISKLKPKGADSWSEAASLAVQQWLGQPMAKFMQFEVMAKRSSLHAVIISDSKKSMNDVLLAGGFAEKVDTEPGLPSFTNSISRTMASSLKSRMDGMKIGEKITGELSDFTSPDRFTATDVSASDVIGELTSLLQSEYKNSSVSYRPVQGELVAAQFSADASWYRAEVTHIDGEICTLYFVDYGNSEAQKVENIRHLTNKILIEAPKQALVCSLFSVQSLSAFESKIVNEECNRLLVTALEGQGHVSLLVKDRTNESLLVDIIDHSGQSLSDKLIRKLSGLPLETKKAQSDRSTTVGKNETKMNKLPSAPSKTARENVTMSDLGSETLALDNGEPVSVLVSACKSSVEFYVRLDNKNKLFIAMMKELDRSVAASPRLSAPSVGHLAAALMSEHGIWCRGVIEKIEGNRCLVHFIDSGNSEQILLSALKELPSSTCLLPAQAIRCCLDGKLQMSPLSDQKFKDIVEQSSVDIKVIRKDSGVFSVQVFQGGVDIGATLAASCCQPTVEPISAIKNPKATSEILMETLPASGEPVTAMVTHIDSFSRLFITCKDVTDLMIQLNKSADSLPLLSSPAVGSLCAAQYSKDSNWYRACIVGIQSPKTCTVQFLDYGNSEETSMSHLRELSPELRKFPGQAICCCLLGYESELGLPRPKSNATELMNKLRLELVEKTFTVRVVDKQSEVLIVKLENEHSECVNTKYQPASLAVAATPRLSDVTFEQPPDTQFEAAIMHINSLSDFYCQMFDKEKLGELDSLSEHLRTDVSRLGEDILLDPVVNGVYASQFMGTWYRCVVEEVRNTKVLIRYIDYGNSEEILASQLRPLNPERLQVPVRLLRCKLYGVTPLQENWSNPHMPDYLAVLRQSKLDLVIESRDADVFHVSVFILQDDEKVSVATDLVNIGMAKFLQVVTPQKDESKYLMPDPQKPSQQAANEDDDDDDAADNIDENELRRKIEELQLMLKLTEQKKKKK